MQEPLQSPDHSNHSGAVAVTDAYQAMGNDQRVAYCTPCTGPIRVGSAGRVTCRVNQECRVIRELGILGVGGSTVVALLDQNAGGQHAILLVKAMLTE